MSYGDFKSLLKEQFLTKYCLIKFLVLLKIQIMMDISMELLQWLESLLVKSLLFKMEQELILQINVLRISYNRSNSFLFVNGVKNYQFKAKDSEIKSYRLFLDNIPKDFTVEDWSKWTCK